MDTLEKRLAMTLKVQDAIVSALKTEIELTYLLAELDREDITGNVKLGARLAMTKLDGCTEALTLMLNELKADQ